MLAALTHPRVEAQAPGKTGVMRRDCSKQHARWHTCRDAQRGGPAASELPFVRSGPALGSSPADDLLSILSQLRCLRTLVLEQRLHVSVSQPESVPGSAPVAEGLEGGVIFAPAAGLLRCTQSNGRALRVPGTCMA